MHSLQLIEPSDPMLTEKRITLPFLLLLLTICTLFSGCFKAEQADKKSFSPPPMPQDRTRNLQPPHLLEVKNKIKKVYRDAVTLETGPGQFFMSGDFNGDTWPDLAVAVRPGPGKLAEINHELANWIVGDPKTIPYNPKETSTREVPKTGQTRIEQNDL